MKKETMSFSVFKEEERTPFQELTNYTRLVYPDDVVLQKYINKLKQ